jgi:hypothetical protein
VNKIEKMVVTKDESLSFNEKDNFNEIVKSNIEEKFAQTEEIFNQ